MARILIIDDDICVRAAMGRVLLMAGHEVYLAADGIDGIEQQHARPVDLIITDLFMPNMEGFETMKQLHHEFPDLPVIVMSGEDLEMLHMASPLGAVAILGKPFSTDELFEAVDQALQLEVAA